MSSGSLLTPRHRSKGRVAAPPAADLEIGIRTLKLTVGYDGASFHGWQVQPGLPTVQGVLTEALEQILREPVRVVGASRTDAGVHAIGQVASLTMSSALSLLAIRSGLNAKLPREIRVSAVEEAQPGFDARRWALAKRYAYFIESAPVASPLRRGFMWHVSQPLDGAAMMEALGFIRGRRDFTSFCAAPGRARDPVCRIFSAKLRRRRWSLAFLFSADSFLHHMVRNIVGSLVEVGRGRRPPEWIREVLLARDRTLAGPTAPAHGLVLLRALYPRD